MSRWMRCCNTFYPAGETMTKSQNYSLLQAVSPNNNNAGTHIGSIEWEEGMFEIDDKDGIIIDLDQEVNCEADGVDEDEDSDAEAERLFG